MQPAHAMSPVFLIIRSQAPSKPLTVYPCVPQSANIQFAIRTGGVVAKQEKMRTKQKKGIWQFAIRQQSRFAGSPRRTKSVVSLIEQSKGPHGSSVADSVREQLRKSINRNFEGREYIARPVLLQIISKDVVHGLCQDHIFGRTHSRVTKGTPAESTQGMVEYIELEARVLLALWVFIDAPMQGLLALLEAGTSDASLPLTVDCPAGIDNIDFVRILESQWVFLPYDLFAQPDQVVIPKDLIVPLIFDKKRDLIGAGAFSDVFQVEVDNTHSTLSSVICVHGFPPF